MQIVAVCNFHPEKDITDWATLVINIKEQKFVIHELKSWNFKRANLYREEMKNISLPVARLVPQIMKAIGYFETHNIMNPQYAQWEMAFGPHSGRDAHYEKDNTDCTLYCMKYLERFLCMKDTYMLNGLVTKERSATTVIKWQRPYFIIVLMPQ